MKILKRIGAGFLGAVMVGASLLVPAAIAENYTLADYPAPFVTDGSTDMLIVVGADASPADVVGAINIAVRLGSEPGTPGECPSTGTTTTTMTGESASLASGSKYIYLKDELNEEVSVITKDNLPTILADGTFTDDDGTTYDYEQVIDIGDDAVFQFDKSDNDLDDPALHIELPSSVGASTYIYRLRVDFDKAVNFTATASKGEKITLFGNEYTIGSSTDSTYIQLLGGAKEVPLDTVGETITGTFEGKNYEITLIGVTSTPKATIKVTYNGVTETETIAEGSTKEVAGLDIYAKTINYYGLESNPGNAVIQLGADEIWLSDGNEVQKGSSKEDVDGTYVKLTGGTTATTSLTIAVSAADNDYDHLLAGESFTDPVFGTVKVTLADIPNAPTLSEDKGEDTNTDRKKIEISRASDDALQVKFEDKNGNTKTIEFADGPTQNNVELEDDDDHDIKVVEGATLQEDDYTILNSGDYQHFIQITKISCTDDDEANDDVHLKDLFTGTTYRVDDKDLGDDGDTTTVTIKGQTYTIEADGNACANGVKIYSSDYGTTDNSDYVSVYPYIETVAGKDFRVAFTEDVALPSFTITDGLTATSKYNIVLPTGTVTTSIRDADSGAGTVKEEVTLTYSGSSVVLDTNDENADLQVGTVVYTFTADSNVTDGTATITVSIDTDQTVDNDAGEGDAGILFVEDEDAQDSNNKNAVIIPMAGDNSQYTDVDYSNIKFTGNAYENKVFDDTKYQGSIDAFGTYVQIDKSDSHQDFAVLTYPTSQMYADVFVSEIASEVSTTGGTGTTTYEQVVPVVDNIARLDTDPEVEKAKTEKNLILIGSPAVNRLTAAALDVDYPTYGYQWTKDANLSAKVPIPGEGNAIIKLVEDAFTTGKVALIVAGWSAEDTQAACTALQQYKKGEYGTYNLTEEEVTVGETTVKLID